MIAGAADDAVSHGHLLGRAPATQCQARLGADRVIIGFDEAVRDADKAGAIGVDAIGVPVQDHDAIDIHIVATEKTDGVARGVPDGNAPNR